MASGPAPSVLFLSNGDPADPFYASGIPARLFDWLKASFPSVIPLDVSLGGAARLLNRALAWSPRRERWKARLDLNMWSFTRRSRFAQAFVDQRAPAVDALFQLSCLWAPPRVRDVPLFLLLDFTNAIAQSEYPDWAPFRSRSEARRWLDAEREVYARAYRIFAASTRVRHSLIGDYGVAPEKVVVVGLGGHVEQSAQTDKGYDGRTILFVGRDFDRKGGPLLLEAFARVRSTLPDARLLVVGPRARGAQPGVTWLGALTDRAQLSGLFEHAHVFAMPSWCEPFGQVFVEAMSHRLPCVGTNTGGVPDVIDDGVTGYLIERGDVGALASALLALLASPELSRAFGDAGFGKAEAFFTWPVVCEKMRSEIASPLHRP